MIRAIGGASLIVWMSSGAFGRPAYHLKNYQVSGTTPLMADDSRYEITAKAEGEAAPTEDEFRQMLQSLLAGRFKLKVHREMREMPVYELMVGKNGPRFKQSAPD